MLSMMVDVRLVALRPILYVVRVDVLFYALCHALPNGCLDTLLDGHLHVLFYGHFDALPNGRLHNLVGIFNGCLNVLLDGRLDALVF